MSDIKVTAPKLHSPEVEKWLELVSKEFTEKNKEKIALIYRDIMIHGMSVTRQQSEELFKKEFKMSKPKDIQSMEEIMEKLYNILVVLSKHSESNSPIVSMTLTKHTYYEVIELARIYSDCAQKGHTSFYIDPFTAKLTIFGISIEKEK